jgi:hypothetical protein
MPTYEPPKLIKAKYGTHTLEIQQECSRQRINRVEYIMQGETALMSWGSNPWPKVSRPTNPDKHNQYGQRYEDQRSQRTKEGSPIQSPH